MPSERFSSTLVNVSSHQSQGKSPILFPPARVGPARMERTTWAVFTFGGLAIVLSLVCATWATMQYQDSNRLVTPTFGSMQAASSYALGPSGGASPASIRHGRGGVPRTGVARGTVDWTAPSGSANGAFGVLGWNDLTLMLRTGLSDDEVIAAVAGKRLTGPIGEEQEQLLRGLGAGSRLVNFLRAQPVSNVAYRMPDRVIASAFTPPKSVQPPTYVPPVTPVPVVDYAARDREIARLKKQIDDLDEKMRVVRTNPRDSRYWWHYASDYGTNQRSYDACMKQIDDERNDLRRQKWALEGR